MIQTDKEEILIGLLSDTHVPQRTTVLPDVVIEDFKKTLSIQSYKHVSRIS